MVEDGRTVLCPVSLTSWVSKRCARTASEVGTLRVQSGRVVRAVEELDELAVSNSSLLVLQTNTLGVVCPARADLPVR